VDVSAVIRRAVSLKAHGGLTGTLIYGKRIGLVSR
jgi:hypothetical protein